jgi:hypothetical protein
VWGWFIVCGWFCWLFVCGVGFCGVLCVVCFVLCWIFVVMFFWFVFVLVVYCVLVGVFVCCVLLVGYGFLFFC